MKRNYLCPLCDGLAEHFDCYCGGSGLVTEHDALEFAALTGEPVKRVSDPPVSIDSPCHDCAFRADSPERESGTIRDVMASVEIGQPFHCHVGMHLDGRGRYQPLETDGRGMPIGHPICAGWNTARAKFLARAERRAG
jgi:hypothetical protein